MHVYCGDISSCSRTVIVTKSNDIQKVFTPLWSELRYSSDSMLVQKLIMAASRVWGEGIRST
ncbi:hypothetical protein EON65_27430 [archaeon]|nr:MAG: hypothetical protein EON65_27430 [archaeon]